uniref:Clusterin C-terminal domain-containing protein n=1 Tax=Malurus cyaneus samueli TaxID=2593467 RepID=A0A8C5TSS5_9PASS
MGWDPWNGMDGVGWDRMGLGWNGIHGIGMGLVGMGWDWDGIHGMGWDEMGWSGVDGMGWDGLGWMGLGVWMGLGMDGLGWDMDMDGIAMGWDPWNVIGMGSMGWDWDGTPPRAALTPSLSPDCGDVDPSQQELREQLEDAVRVAERFTRRYDALLREFQEEMLNTSGLLDQLNRQFGWVSRLANFSREPDGFLQVTTVSPEPRTPRPPDTQVTVQLFDSEPLALTVPGDIPWDDPKFMEIVAEQALRHYKENAM